MSDNNENTSVPVTTERSDSSSNPAKKQQITGAVKILPKVQDVTACLNEQNPVREIIVRWTKSELLGDFQYEVHLESNTATGKKVEYAEASAQEKCFKELKSNTKYTACVAIIQNQQKSESTSSNTVQTKNAIRTSGFDIEIDGKPTITTCQYNDKAESQFRWSLPNIGVEKKNYRFLFANAWVTEEGKLREPLVVEDNVRAQPKVLEIMKNYEFTVQCSYKDLDFEHEGKNIIQVTTKFPLSTDIGEPRIDDVRWSEQDIMVDWSPALHAEQHKLQVLDGKQVLVKEFNLDKSKTHGITFSMTSACNYGKTCEFILEATKDSKVKEDKKNILIGGDIAVTSVSLKTCEEYPSRQLVVEWNTPIIKPHGYVIKLFEVNPRQILMRAESDLVTNPILKTYRFIELKTSTEYICEVSPEYGNKLQPGSSSNQKKTGLRVKSILESDADIGKLQQINHIEKIETNNLFVTLKWGSSLGGENYRMKGYNVEVSPPGRLSVTVFKSNLPPKTESVCIGKLKHGQQYNVLFTTKCIDLDKPDREQKFKTEYQFCTSPSKAVIKPCFLKDGMITFSWEPVAGAKNYRMVIKNEELTENLSQDEKVNGKDCKAKVKISEKLCVGRTCMTKVYSYANNQTSETEWKNHLIGGELVPRNVKSIKNTHEPDRSILVTFDAPKKGPADKYEIFIVPQYGKKKIVHTRDTTNVIQYLRKGIKYKFIVSAKHGDDWSECAESTPLQTSGGDKENPVFIIDRAKGTQFNMHGAQFTGKTTLVNIHKGEEFGQVRDLTTTEISHKQDDIYQVELSWKVPSFDNEARSYKVETYKVEIRRKDSSNPQVLYLKFQKELQVYKTKAVILNLGENYEMLVSTVYIDIDNDEEYISTASRITLQTRPCKPAGLRIKILKGANENDELEIEWHSSNGAESYKVEIFTENSNKGPPLFKDDVKGATTWKRKFDGVFGYGITYHAVITAVGNDGKTNSTTTNLKTIGDNFAPKMVQASIDNDKVNYRNTQVYLSWEPPAEPPEVYEITSEDAKNLGVISCNDTNKLITGLKAGVSYTFKVVAIKNHNRSGASLSNRVKTNPTPTKVQGVQTRKGPNPSTSIKILWGKVDAEKLNESTKYLVLVSTLDDKIKNEINVTEEHVIVEGLLPGTKYFTTVAGGNSEGYGRNSEFRNRVRSAKEC